MTILSSHQNIISLNLYHIVYCLRTCSELEQKSDILAEWLQQINWVRYDVEKDAESYLYMKYKHEKFLSNHETAFVSKRYSYWKEATIVFRKHQTSDCHCEAMEELLVLPHINCRSCQVTECSILFTKFTGINIRTFILQRFPGGISPNPLVAPHFACSIECSTHKCHCSYVNLFLLIISVFHILLSYRLA